MHKLSMLFHKHYFLGFVIFFWIVGLISLFGNRDTIFAVNCFILTVLSFMFWHSRVYLPNWNRFYISAILGMLAAGTFLLVSLWIHYGNIETYQLVAMTILITIYYFTTLLIVIAFRRYKQFLKQQQEHPDPSPHIGPKE